MSQRRRKTCSHVHRVAMSKLSPPKIIVPLVLLLAAVLVGCSHQKTQRGHLFRGDWAVEYNRTPWIGMPPDSVYHEVGEKSEKAESRGLFGCFMKEGREKHRKGFRHHCAMNAECSPQEPCCRTLGCGMWVDPEEPATHASLGGAAQACGLLPFCLPQKPCGLTPVCGRPANINVNPQTLMQAKHPIGIPSGMPIVRGMNPTATMPGAATPSVLPNGTLVSRGIVPGASTITSGGVVAAIGVATPAGMMTPVGVRMPNGVVSNAVVLRARVMTPNCTAARPCCLTPHCGGAVAVNMVANNATVLASALQSQGVASGVMQTGGMGMLVNPITNQPVPGLTMSGYPQMGYPPIGYAPTGYAPGYPRFAAGMAETGEAAAQREEEVAPPPETRSQMPVPRFHPIPTQPAFQRSEGMAPTQGERTSAMNGRQEISEMELERALDQAYLEGVSAAMDEVERKLEEQRQAVAKAKLQEKILQQSENLRQQLDAREEMRILVMQCERQLQQHQQQAAMQQQAMQQQTLRQPEMLATAVPEPRSQRVSPPRPAAAVPAASASPALLAGNLKTSVVSGVNEIFAPLLGANQNHGQSGNQGVQVNQRGQALTPPQPQRSVAQPRVEVAVVQPDVPVRPPVLPVAPRYGLSPDDEADSPIMQAHFSDDGVPIQP